MKKTYILKVALCAVIAISALTLLSCSEKCAHVAITSSVTEPTHTSQGFTTRTCPECGYSYECDYVAPLGHTFVSQVFAPSCTEQGYTHYECDCGYAFDSDFVPPLGHTLSTASVAATCDTEGYKIADCTVCGEHYTYDITSPLGHALLSERGYVSATQQTASTHYTCERCDLDYFGDHLFYHDVYKGAHVKDGTVLAKGLDVSYHNHEQNGDGSYTSLNWTHIKSQGFDFVILRAGYMKSGNQLYVDPVFEKNYAEAKAAGLDVGAYFFSYAYSIEDAQAEARAFLTLLEGKQFEYPVFFDIEHSAEKIAEKGLTRSELTDICVEFISTLQQNGYYAALYTNEDWLVSYLDRTKIVTLFDVWYARYLSNTDTVVDATWDVEKYGPHLCMWQFSKTGIIDGVYYKYKKDGNGAAMAIPFDMNYAFRDYPALIRELGLNGYTLQKDLSALDVK